MINYNCSGNCKDCGKCTRYIFSSEQTSIKTQLNNFPQDFCPDVVTAPAYGVAFDLGTTTVSGTLWELKGTRFIGSVSLPNYQRIYGPDVISRILACNQDEKNLALLQTALLQCMKDIINKLCSQNDIAPVRITRIILVGNSTMSHLVFGIHPRSLSVAPFEPMFYESQFRTATDLNLSPCPQAKIFLLPNVGGHVGSDTTGMILATRLHERSGCHLAIDIGTNGEIVAIKNGKMLACSTAAGPAFEGISIHHGMCAAPGAIEHVKYKNYDIKIETIDSQPPVGICGSGLIAAVACLLKCGIIDKHGRMITKEEALDAHLPQTLIRRLIIKNGSPAFILAFRDYDMSVILTQQDIREIQLAKGAILAGIQTLMKALDITVEAIDSILLAGAFGNYIDKESALRIGLLPQISIDKIIPVGNAAGTGANMSLLSERERSLADTIARNAEHIELSANIYFQEFYIEAMEF